MKTIFLCSFLLLYTLGSNAIAKSNFRPSISNSLTTETQLDDKYQSSDRRDEFRNVSALLRLRSRLEFTDKISLNSQINLNQIDNDSELSRRAALSTGGGDRTYENLGIFVQQLYLKYDNKKYSVRIGKTNLSHGLAWMWDRGIWAYQIAQDNYRRREELAVRGSYILGNAKENGEYTFTAAAFKYDRKNLDNSIISKRDTTIKQDAVPGDHDSLRSYQSNLNIKFDFGEREKLLYHFSYINLAVNERLSSIDHTKIDDQKGFVVGMNYNYPLNDRIDLDALIEYSAVQNLGGDSDIKENYLTANLITKFYKNWNITLAHAGRYQKEFNENGEDETLSEISFGYQFDKNSFFDKLTMQIGYRNLRVNQKTALNESDTVGLLVRYYKNF